MSNEQSEDRTEAWVRVGVVADFVAGTATEVVIGEQAIAVYCLESDGSIHASDNICTHALAYLTDGWVDGDMIECPLHGGCFDIRTGRGLCEPITVDLRTHEVRVEDEAVYVRVAQ